MLEAIKYDKLGRMKYNPLYHSKSGTPWNDEDIKYLVEWYDKIGVEEMSFALERTEGTVIERVRELRKKGIMKRPQHRNYTHKEVTA